MSGYDEDKRYAVVAEVRRKWTDAEKQAILADAVETSVSAAARRAGVAAGLVFRWRKQQNGGKKSAGKQASVFVPALLPAPSPAALAASPEAGRGTIEIELLGGRRVRVSGPIDVGMLKQVIAAVEER